jgi:hypothetical protein
VELTNRTMTEDGVTVLPLAGIGWTTNWTISSRPALTTARLENFRAHLPHENIDCKQSAGGVAYPAALPRIRLGVGIVFLGHPAYSVEAMMSSRPATRTRIPATVSPSTAPSSSSYGSRFPWRLTKSTST